MTSIGSMEDIQNRFKESIAKFMENDLETELGYRQVRLQKQGHR